MSDKKADAPKPESEAKPAGTEGVAPGGGIKAFLPLIVTIILMPVLAFTTTKFLVLPKVVAARGGAAPEDAGHGDAGSAATDGGGQGEEASKGHGDSSSSHGATKDAKGSDGNSHGKKKQNVPISKVIVNVAGSMGTRYLMTSFTLVGTQDDFKTMIEENKDQLLDLANTAMASKTIGELEKPGSRNQLRAELISIFNNALGSGLVQEIYFTEFAVQ